MKRRSFIQSLSGGAAAALLLPGMPSITHSAIARLVPLADHKIDNIQFSEVQMRWPRLVGKNAQLDTHGYGPMERICVITTDQGATGWGTTRGSQDELNAAHVFAKGKMLSEIFDPAAGVTRPEVLPLDIALHDLSGIILNQPVYEMLGKPEPFITSCYSGMIYFDDIDPKEKPSGLSKIIEECQFDYDYGYRMFKLKIGRGNKWMPKAEGLNRDIEVTKEVAKNFPDCKILVDANNGYSVEDTINYLTGIGDIALFWIEEPFHEDEQKYKQLRQWLIDNDVQTLLADGEANPDETLLMKLEKEKLVDVHLTDIIGYGFTPWRKLMPELKKMETPASPHAWGSALKTYYIAQLAGGLGNVVTIEGVTSESDDVDFGTYHLENGNLIPSDAPGFGMKLLKDL